MTPQAGSNRAYRTRGAADSVDGIRESFHLQSYLVRKP